MWGGAAPVISLTAALGSPGSLWGLPSYPHSAPSSSTGLPCACPWLCKYFSLFAVNEGRTAWVLRRRGCPAEYIFTICNVHFGSEVGVLMNLQETSRVSWGPCHSLLLMKWHFFNEPLRKRGYAAKCLRKNKSFWRPF